MAATMSVAVPSVFAQSGAAARRQLVQSAQEAARAGRHAEAIELATRAIQVMSTPSVRAFLATEQLAVQHYAEALDAAELCKLEAARDPTLRNRDVIVRTCTQAGDEAKAHVGSVVVKYQGEVPSGLAITVSGHPLNEAFYGVAYYVNPGSVSVEAKAPHFVTSQQTVEVAVGASVEITVTLAREPEPEPPPVDVARPPDLQPPPRPIETPPPLPPPPRSAAPWVVVGIGGGLVVASAALFITRSVLFGGLSNDCLNVQDKLVCPNTQDFRGRYDTIVGLNATAITTAIVGGVALTAGVIWAGVAAAPRRRASIVPQLQIGESGVWVGIGGTL